MLPSCIAYSLVAPFDCIRIHQFCICSVDGQAILVIVFHFFDGTQPRDRYVQYRYGMPPFSVLFASLNVKKDKMLIDGAINVVNIAIWFPSCNFFSDTLKWPQKRGVRGRLGVSIGCYGRGVFAPVPRSGNGSRWFWPLMQLECFKDEFFGLGRLKSLCLSKKVYVYDYWVREFL